jgi:uncharacterized membrane protein
VSPAPGTVAAGNERRLELVPNCSLTPRGAVLFFLSLCLASFAVAGYFAARGLWPILPFAGLEMGLLGFALWTSMRRRHHVQSILVTEDRVEVVTCGPGPARNFTALRHWTRVAWLDGDPRRGGRLVLESQGRRCEIGALLSDEERRGIYLRLRAWLGEMNESPPLA